MQIKSKFWLEDDDGEPVFGEGRQKILELIDELGSMQATAKALNMSYRGVWARIKATEERLGLKLVETSVGRGKNRGSRLTPAAHKLLEDYKILNERGMIHSDELFAAIFEGQGMAEKATTPAVAVVGPPNSGKTDLINRLVETWTASGRHIGVIQLAKNAQKDSTSEKATLKAGAMTAIQAGTSQVVVRLPADSQLTPESIAANYAPGCDVVLVESRERLHIPSIDLFRKDLAKSPLTRKSKDLLAVIGDRPANKPDWPHFELDDIAGLIELVEEKLGIPQERETVTLMVNGRRVPMLPFVKDIIENGIVGMVTSLKACDNPRVLELTIHR